MSMLKLRKMCGAIRFLLRCEKGVAFLEFALALPLMLLIVLGVISVIDYLRVTHKLERTVAATADVVTQLIPSQYGELTNILEAASVLMMQPYPVIAFPASPEFIVTDVQTAQRPNAPPEIVWQAGGGAYTSTVGPPGYAGSGENCTLATLVQVASNPNFMAPNSEIVVVEAYFQYQPLFTQFMGLDGNVTLYRAAFFTPRNGTLTNLPGNGTCNLW